MIQLWYDYEWQIVNCRLHVYLDTWVICQQIILEDQAKKQGLVYLYAYLWKRKEAKNSENPLFITWFKEDHSLYSKTLNTVIFCKCFTLKLSIVKTSKLFYLLFPMCLPFWLPFSFVCYNSALILLLTSLFAFYYSHCSSFYLRLVDFV